MRSFFRSFQAPVAAGARPGGNHRAEAGDKGGRSCNLRGRSIPCQEAGTAAAAAGSCAAVRCAPAAVCLVHADWLIPAIVQRMKSQLKHDCKVTVMSWGKGRGWQLIILFDTRRSLAFDYWTCTQAAGAHAWDSKRFMFMSVHEGSKHSDCDQQGHACNARPQPRHHCLVCQTLLLLPDLPSQPAQLFVLQCCCSEHA